MARQPAGAACALIAAAAVLPAAAAAQDERLLTVEQTAVSAVAAPAPAGAPAGNPLGVVAWVDHPDNTYAAGERVRLFVQTNKDAYLTVLNVAPDGATTVLFPNRFQTDSLVRANVATEVPDPAGGARITVSGASGAELIKVVASSRPAPVFEAAALGRAGPFAAVPAGAAAAARTLQVVMDDASEAEWDVYDKVIRTVPARPAASAVAPVGTPAPAPVAGAGWPAAAFGLRVAADRPLYRAADPVTLMIRTEADCHLTLLNTGPEGASRMLFPNRWQQQTLIRAGQTVVVPGIGAGVSIRPLGPAGVEHVTAVCRTGDQPVLGAPDGFRAADFPALADAGATARTLSVVADPASASQTAVAATSFVVVQ